MGEHEPTATVPAQSISAQNTSEQATSAQPRTVAPTVRPAPPKIPRPVPAPRVDSPLISAIIADAVSPEELNARILEVVSEGTPIIEPVHREDGSISENERIVTFLYHNEQAEQVLMFINRLTDEKNLDRSLMARIEGTGWWQLSMQMETTWRASYNFLPALPGERPPGWAMTTRCACAPPWTPARATR